MAREELTDKRLLAGEPVDPAPQKRCSEREVFVYLPGRGQDTTHVPVVVQRKHVYGPDGPTLVVSRAEDQAGRAGGVVNYQTVARDDLVLRETERVAPVVGENNVTVLVKVSNGITDLLGGLTKDFLLELSIMVSRAGTLLCLKQQEKAAKPHYAVGELQLASWARRKLSPRERELPEKDILVNAGDQTFKSAHVAR